MIIYKITNLINGKAYIGQTSRSLKKRFKEHANCRNSAIGKALKKYGRENFTIEEIEQCETIEQANELEQYYIEHFNTIAPNGYNLTEGGKNCTISKETRLKMSTAHKGRHLSLATKAKIAAYRQGRRHSSETIAKMKGRKCSPETITKMKSRKCSLATRKKLSERQKGRRHSPETIEKMKKSKQSPEVKAKMRRKRSPEGRANISASAKRRAQTPEGRAKLLAASMKAKALAEEKRRQKLEQQAKDKEDQNA